MKKKSPKRKANLADKSRAALERYVYRAHAVDKMTFIQITDHINAPVEDGGLGKAISQSGVYRIYRVALAERISQIGTQEELRAGEIDHLDALIQEALTMVGHIYVDEHGKRHLRAESNRLAAINTVARLGERKAKLLGTDAPIEIRAEVVHFDNADLELAKLLEAVPDVAN